MTKSMAAGAPLVLDLLNYIEQVEKLKTKPNFSVPTEFFVAHQHELKGVHDLQFNLQVEGDDVWLRLPRLQEIPPPELDEELKPWVTLSRSPEKSPELKNEIINNDGKQEISRELLKDHPETREAFNWYVEFQWDPWAVAERPRRKTIARYNQLFSLQQAISSEGAETPLELVWGIGYAAWKKEGFATPVKHPLIVQSCEITLNEKTFELEVRPRDIEPRLETDCYAEMELPGVKQLEAYWRSALSTGANRVNPFEYSTFDGTLKAAVLLKEHFRCVPAIIEFSNREFYQGDIRPLRVPKANERLDPPLVDVFVKGGFRKADVNNPEAKAVVDEIEAILGDPQFDGRSIGVVTLLGTTQAARIHELVSERISPVDVVARKLAIGPPPVFQGRERDIMLVSMVLGPGDRAAANRADMRQRFNVALSRARDRMYLFRSITDTEFSEESLNGRVIRHFKQPFQRDAKKVKALRERCESGFELEMFDELVKRGFRVEPQIPCGGYRIDFVVEGNEGRRLAIECDGDRFHGPGQWQDDMARQRVLERAGWTFWRCFASSFVRRREAVLDDLMQTLERLGIDPLGAESVDNTVWVHHKEVDPYGVDEKPEIVQA
jgi:very-short-patch-repair endonuclease